jgi:hypothetical protein
VSLIPSATVVAQPNNLNLKNALNITKEEILSLFQKIGLFNHLTNGQQRILHSEGLFVLEELK